MQAWAARTRRAEAAGATAQRGQLRQQTRQPAGARRPLGSANVELDWSLGSFVDREEFRPYGETSFGSYANKRYRFTGKERDEESGLNYHGARYYAPGLARWMSPDPKGLVDGVNLYGYVRSNPLNPVYESYGHRVTTHRSY